jgi:hypothetical protein
VGVNDIGPKSFGRFERGPKQRSVLKHTQGGTDRAVVSDFLSGSKEAAAGPVVSDFVDKFAFFRVKFPQRRLRRRSSHNLLDAFLLQAENNAAAPDRVTMSARDGPMKNVHYSHAQYAR